MLTHDLVNMVLHRHDTLDWPITEPCEPEDIRRHARYLRTVALPEDRAAFNALADELDQLATDIDTLTQRYGQRTA